MTKKINIAILCGGQSAEHEVSLESSKNVLQALDPAQYQVHLIFIDKNGNWFLLDDAQALLKNPYMQPLADTSSLLPMAVRPGHDLPFLVIAFPIKYLNIDIVFPVLHGTHGEDGTLQGLLELLNLPYVGADVLGSAVAMDKEYTKKLLKVADIPIADWVIVHKEETAKLDFNHLSQQLGLPFFVKPACTGSSVGVSKVKNLNEFEPALALAQKYDHKIIIERYIPGREIECAVLGNEHPEASLPGEIIPHHEFYSYEAKYLDPEGASLKFPAELDEDTVARVQEMAKKTFVALGCEGMARVDFFLTPEGELILNEANTLPGFTQISMYPKLWSISGLAYPHLIDRLIALAFERFKRNKVLKRACDADKELSLRLT